MPIRTAFGPMPARRSPLTRWLLSRPAVAVILALFLLMAVAAFTDERGELTAAPSGPAPAPAVAAPH